MKYKRESTLVLKYVGTEDLYSPRVWDVSRSTETTQTCKRGRSATIRLRCNPTVTVKDHITLPRYFTLLLSSIFDHSDNISYNILILFSTTVTVQRGRVMVVLSTFCGRASMHVHSAPKTTTGRLSVLASREYR